MTRLRPTTARAIDRYPDTPVRYHRPILRVVAGVFLVGESVLSILLTYFPEGKGDDLTGDDWWLHLLFLVTLGGLYLLVSSSVVVTRSDVIVRNPFRRVEIPLGHVKMAVRSSNLRIKTVYRDFVAAGVEAANVQVFTGDYGTQADLVTLINKAAAEATSQGDGDDSQRAQYHFAWPDPLFLAFAVIHIVGAAVVLLNDGPMRV